MHRLTGCNFFREKWQKTCSRALRVAWTPPPPIESSTTSHRFILLSFVLVENYHGGNGWKKEKEISGFVQEM